MRVLGFDPSLTAFGWSWSDGGPEGEHGVWKLKDARGYARVDWLLGQVLDKLREVRPDEVVVEGYSFASHGNVVYQIAGLGEKVRYLLWANSIPWITFSPQQRAQYATGKGAADKKAVKAAWEEAMGIKFRDHNVCDAHVLMTMGLRLRTGQGICVGSPSILDKYQQGEVRPRERSG